MIINICEKNTHTLKLTPNLFSSFFISLFPHASKKNTKNLRFDRAMPITFMNLYTFSFGIFLSLPLSQFLLLFSFVYLHCPFVYCKKKIANGNVSLPVHSLSRSFSLSLYLSLWYQSILWVDVTLLFFSWRNGKENAFFCTLTVQTNECIGYVFLPNLRLYLVKVV